MFDGAIEGMAAGSGELAPTWARGRDRRESGVEQLDWRWSIARCEGFELDAQALDVEEARWLREADPRSIQLLMLLRDQESKNSGKGACAHASGAVSDVVRRAPCWPGRPSAAVH